MNKEMDSNVKELRRIGELYACKEALRNELDDLAFEEREDLESQKDNFVANLFKYQAEQSKKLKIPKNNAIIKKSILIIVSRSFYSMGRMTRIELAK